MSLFFSFHFCASSGPLRCFFSFLVLRQFVFRSAVVFFHSHLCLDSKFFFSFYDTWIHFGQAFVDLLFLRCCERDFLFLLENAVHSYRSEVARRKHLFDIEPAQAKFMLPNLDMERFSAHFDLFFPLVNPFPSGLPPYNTLYDTRFFFPRFWASALSQGLAHFFDVSRRASGSFRLFFFRLLFLSCFFSFIGPLSPWVCKAQFYNRPLPPPHTWGGTLAIFFKPSPLFSPTSSHAPRHSLDNPVSIDPSSCCFFCVHPFLSNRRGGAPNKCYLIHHLRLALEWQHAPALPFPSFLPCLAPFTFFLDNFVLGRFFMFLWRTPPPAPPLSFLGFYQPPFGSFDNLLGTRPRLMRCVSDISFF